MTSTVCVLTDFNVSKIQELCSPGGSGKQQLTVIALHKKRGEESLNRWKISNKIILFNNNVNQVQGGGEEVRSGPHVQGDGQEVRDPPLHRQRVGQGVGEAGQVRQLWRLLPRKRFEAFHPPMPEALLTEPGNDGSPGISGGNFHTLVSQKIKSRLSKNPHSFFLQSGNRMLCLLKRLCFSKVGCVSPTS